jgi:hypothetical protein
MFKGRSAIEIMVVVFTFVIAVTVMGLGLAVGIVKIRDPSADVGTAVSSLTSVVASILAALLGLVAGRSDALGSTSKRADNSEATVYERPPKPDPPSRLDPPDM